MKPRGALALLLSLSIPSASFAQTVSSARAVESIPGAPSALNGAPSVFEAPALSLSAPSIAAGLTPALAPAPSALAAAALPAAALPEKPAVPVALVPAAPAASAPHSNETAGEARKAYTAAEIAALRAAWNAPAEGPGKTSGPDEVRAGSRLFDGSTESASTLSAPASGKWSFLRGLLRRKTAVSPAALDARGELKLYKRVLGDGGAAPDGSRIEPFSFRTPAGIMKARSAGLEGFLYSRRELARAGFTTSGQLESQFKYLDDLLASAPRARALREELSRLRASDLSPAVKDGRLDGLLASGVSELRAYVLASDPAAEAARRNATYMIFARAYNRLKPGKNFLDSLDEAEIMRIKNDAAIRANEIWLMDIFEIGEINRWGTGGGSSYSIKGYRVKPEYGGDAGLKAFVARAHAAGMRVKVDFIPNHTSLDSDMVKAVPEGFLHVLPPQDLSDEEIMASVPREAGGNHTPIYKLVKTDSYPMPDGKRRPARVLIHHPRTDYGDVMWVDLAQIDYSRPEARAWQAKELKRLFTELGVDSARRDMAYEILNVRYYDRWMKILGSELRTIPAGWMRDAHKGVMDGFKARWEALKGAEFLEQATDEVKAARPEAVMIDEAYSHADDLSRSGSDGVYNKNDHETAQGQIGLYDAMQSRDAARIREALKYAAFRRWQRGGAPMVNFIGTHDGGEGNPVDKFGRLFSAAALTALMLRPILLYNGFEQAVVQSENVIGDLSKSADREKAIPYDIPVKIDWTKADEGKRSFLKLVLGVGAENQELFDRGAMEVLETAPGTPIAAWTVSRAGKTFLMAANWADGRTAEGVFKFSEPLLSGFGAFSPREDRRYALRDLADVVDGKPREYIRTGRELLENGLYVKLAAGGTHLFEVVDLNAAAASASSGAPSASSSLLRPMSSVTGGGKLARWMSAGWNEWVGRLVYLALVPFFLLQTPQIVANFHNLGANPSAISILPWIGYSTGILANSNLWGYHIDGKRTAVAFVQGAGVLTSSIVLAQIYLAGFMPAAAAAVMAGLIALSVGVNALRWTGKLGDGPWKAWGRLSALLGLFALPMGFSVTFNLMNTHPVAVLAASLAFAAVGAAAMALDRLKRLPARLSAAWGTLGAWLGTMLFVFLPIPQIVNNFAHPENIKGLAIGTLLLATLGNMLETTGALNAKSQIWFVGSFWAIAVGGWGVLLSMVLYGAVSPALFIGYSIAVPAALAWVVRKVKNEHKDASYRDALKFILKGDKK